MRFCLNFLSAILSVYIYVLFSTSHYVLSQLYVFLGIREGGVSENAAYYVFTHAADGAIEAFPLHEWWVQRTYVLKIFFCTFLGINFSQFRDIKHCQLKKQSRNLANVTSISIIFL